MRIKQCSIWHVLTLSLWMLSCNAFGDQKPIYTGVIQRLDEPTRMVLAAKYVPEIFTDDFIIDVYRSCELRTKVLFFGIKDRQEDLKILANEFQST